MKILVVLLTIKSIGGISSSLLNFINEIKKDNSITVYVLDNYIDPSVELPNDVCVIKGNNFLEDCFVPRKVLKHHTVFRKCVRYGRLILRKIIGRENAIKYGIKRIRHNEQYDIAIAFSNDIYDKAGHMVSGGAYLFVDKNVNAKVKFAWIHNELYSLGFNREICLRDFKNFDYVVNVSQDCKKQFDSLVPEYRDKSIVIYNMYNLDKIHESAVAFNPYLDNSKIHFVTVARISNKQKRIDRIITAVKSLSVDKRGLIDWTIVGDGEDYKYITELIENADLKDVIKMVGLQTNPYPYMRYADIFLLPSVYEGYGMTVREAQIVGCPVLITDFGPAHEIVLDRITGIICENTDDAFSEAVDNILGNLTIVSTIKQYLNENPLTNDVARDQFYEAVKDAKKIV